MNLRMRNVLAAAAAMLVAGLLAVQAPAQHKGHHPKKDAPADKPAMEKPKCEMCAAMKQQKGEIKKLLTEAKAAAQEKGATDAADKIGRALDLMEQHQKSMQEMMKKHMDKKAAGREGDKETKGESGKGMKCPMCEKMMQKKTSLTVPGGSPALTLAGLAEGEKIVNARCPIMGTKLDPDRIPERMTREWKGQKIGFCCASCLVTWDRLNDEEKQKKLEAAMD